MAKKFTERKPVSARGIVPSAIDEPPRAMRIDDFPDLEGEREHIKSALTSAVKPLLEDYELESNLEPASHVMQASAPPAIVPAVHITPEKKMISTPIDSGLRKILFELRSDFEISIAFTVETALREYFAGRPTSSIADDLKGRGGRLRRHQK